MILYIMAFMLALIGLFAPQGADIKLFCGSMICYVAQLIYDRWCKYRRYR